MALRDPTPAEIANETSLSLQEAETLTRKIHEKTGWSMPNQAIIENEQKDWERFWFVPLASATWACRR